jgi:WD40 repeat protein
VLGGTRDAADVSCQKTPDNPTRCASAAAVSPDGKSIAYVENTEAVLCEGKTGKRKLKLTELADVPKDGAVRGLVFFQNEPTLVLYGSLGKILLIDSRGWKVGRTIEKPGTIQDVAVGTDGRLMAWVHNDNVVEVYSVEDKRILWSVKDDDRFIRKVRFSAEGSQVLTLSNAGRLKVLDARTGKGIRTVEVGMDRKAGTFIVSQAFLAIGGYNRLEIWDKRTMEKTQELKGHAKNLTVESLAVSPRADLLISGTAGFGRRDGSGVPTFINEIKLWDCAKGTEIGGIDHLGDVLGLAFFPGGDRFITGRLSADGDIEIFDVAALLKDPKRKNGK